MSALKFRIGGPKGVRSLETRLETFGHQRLASNDSSAVRVALSIEDTIDRVCRSREIRRDRKPCRSLRCGRCCWQFRVRPEEKETRACFFFLLKESIQVGPRVVVVVVRSRACSSPPQVAVARDATALWLGRGAARRPFQWDFGIPLDFLSVGETSLSSLSRV